MEMVSLGNTGLQVSRAVLGTMTFGGQVDAAQAASMVDHALERGLNFIDTANVYNNGESERILNGILKGRRDRVVLATKVGIKMGDGPLDRGLSARAIETQLDASLKRLGTDYVDLYYLHQPDYQTPVAESLEAVHRLVQAGKVRCVAASNYAAWQLVQMQWLAKEAGWTPPAVTQPMYNLLARGIEQELLPMCREFGMAAVVYNPLAGGLLSGKHVPAAPISGTRFDTSAIYRDRYWHQANFDAVKKLDQCAKSLGDSLVGLSLRWLLAHQDVTGIILGASKFEQLRQNLDAFEATPLPTPAMEACDQVWDALRGPVPRYNR